MSAVKIGAKHQITIPHKTFEKLHLEEGDYLEVIEQEEGLLLIPKKLIPKDQTWFCTKEWQQKEQEADEAIASGEVSRVYDDVEEMIKDLDS